MSQENVEVVRRSYQAFNENGLAGASGLWDPEIVWHTDPVVGGRPLGQTDRETQFIDWAWIVSVRKGQITHVRSFLDTGRAFEVAGLSE